MPAKASTEPIKPPESQKLSTKRSRQVKVTLNEQELEGLDKLVANAESDRSSVLRGLLNKALQSPPEPSMDGEKIVNEPPNIKEQKIIVMEPREFNDMPKCIKLLQMGTAISVNLTMLEPDQAQRSVDFVAGGAYALNGHQERLGESIFLFAAPGISVTNISDPEMLRAFVSEFQAELDGEKEPKALLDSPKNLILKGEKEEDRTDKIQNTGETNGQLSLNQEHIDDSKDNLSNQGHQDQANVDRIQKRSHESEDIFNQATQEIISKDQFFDPVFRKNSPVNSNTSVYCSSLIEIYSLTMSLAKEISVSKSQVFWGLLDIALSDLTKKEVNKSQESDKIRWKTAAEVTKGIYLPDYLAELLDMKGMNLREDFAPENAYVKVLRLLKVKIHRAPDSENFKLLQETRKLLDIQYVDALAFIIIARYLNKLRPQAKV